MPFTPDLARLSSATIKRRGTVQKHTCSKPIGYPFKLKAAAPIWESGLQFFADMPLGRMLQIVYRSEVMLRPLRAR